ncbi:MAG TPA: DUF6460 domain-containing protein [Xanthobacteraceae bacterium]|nr:DUF6460 domain-containing protein [Xanthobacteraceae bacterium]
MDNGLRHFLGGSPFAVFIKLVLLSILVGFVLYVLGLHPFDIIDGFVALIRKILNLGFSAFYDVWYFFLLGAVVVIPIWLIVRLVQARKR